MRDVLGFSFLQNTFITVNAIWGHTFAMSTKMINFATALSIHKNEQQIYCLK